MPTNLISFPFRLAPTGYVVTREQDDTAYYAELLGVLIATHEGERELTPTFGLTDPTFSDLDAQELAYKVDIFGPPVRLTTVTQEFVTETTVDVRVEFTPLEAAGESPSFDDL